MWFSSLLRIVKSNSTSKRRLTQSTTRRGLTARPQLEALEGRDLPSFSAPVSYAVTLPNALVAADVNHDGNSDLITLRNLYGHSIAVQLGTGNGTFKAPLYSLWAAPSLYYAPTAFAVGDVNGDGTADIVVAYQDTAPFPTNSPPPSPLTVLLGNGQGSFTAAGTYPVFPYDSTITSLALADVDGNGTLDVVATNNVGTLYVAPNLGGGRFGSVQTYSTPINSGSQVSDQVTVGDLNGDGKPDIIVSDPRFDSVSVLLNNGNGTFAPAQTYSVGGTPTAVALGDFNRDGKLDIVTANANGTVSVLLNNNNGTFGMAQNFAVAGPANSVAVGDFNHDGFLDVVTTGAETDLLLGNGKGAFGAYQKVGPAGSNVVAADFNRDGFPGLAEIDSAQANIDVVLNNADWMAGPVSLSFGSITYNSKTKLYSETVTLTNNTSGPLTGPLSLELTNLPSGVVLTDATGTASGNPYIRFLNSGKTLKKGGSVSITLTFTAESLSDIAFGTEVAPL